MEKRILELEKRQQVTEDLEAIKQLHHCYMNNFMAANWDDVRHRFAEDCFPDVLLKNERSLASVKSKKFSKG